VLEEWTSDRNFWLLSTPNVGISQSKAKSGCEHAAKCYNGFMNLTSGKDSVDQVIDIVTFAYIKAFHMPYLLKY
jgi:hypothetical protein